jgi:hypothetical protein
VSASTAVTRETTREGVCGDARSSTSRDARDERRQREGSDSRLRGGKAKGERTEERRVGVPISYLLSESVIVYKTDVHADVIPLLGALLVATVVSTRVTPIL